MNERDCFIAALEIESLPERQAFLDQACGTDRSLRERVEALLRAHQKGNSFLDSPPVVAPASAFDQPIAEKPGSIIGPYKLLQEIGEGGMGVVYMAEQTEPVERRVALKIIKPGMDTRQVIARFQAEEQALAMMDHPNIAKVLDAGATDSGRPYFAMELVKGVPITQYCDEHHLTPRQRLELFVPVCHAVQHAHQKGIIHRDIKPTNVLVAEYDDRPVPKIIDFGVAKAIDQRLTEKSIFTALGQVVGTIEYMSPEQAKLNQLDIDTRSDIYSLGVLLYELLTGETPLDRQRLHAAAFDEMLRIIREEEPPRPSLRLSSSESLPSIAANRQMEPKKLSTLVRRELDWIVMKALEKDRNQRYETANALAHDVENYLHDEPVLACPPSVAYRLRKFTRRNKGPVMAVTLVLLALVVGVVGMTLGLLQARTAARAEREAREAEAQQRLQAEASEKKASEEAAVAKAVKEFLQRDLLGLAGAAAQLGADIEPDPSVKLTTLLDRAAAKVDERFKDQPRVHAEVQDTLARAYESIGRYAEAVRLWEQVRQYCETVHANHPATLAVMSHLAQAYGSAGQHKQALELARQTLELKRKILGPEHPDTFRDMHMLATAYGCLGRHAEALKLHEETLELRRAKLGPDHHETLQSMASVAGSYYGLRRAAEALAIYEQTLTMRKAKLGPTHPDTLKNMGSVANCYDALGRHAEGLKLQEETLALMKANLGPDHPDTLHVMGNVAVCYGKAGRHADALKLQEETLALKRAKLGPYHPNTLTTMDWLACSYGNAGRDAEHIRLHEDALALRKAKLGPNHPDTLNSMYKTAACYAALQRYAEALKLCEETLTFHRTNLGPEAPYMLDLMSLLARCYIELDQYAAGARMLDDCLKRAVGKSVRPGLIPVMIGLHARLLKKAKDRTSCRGTVEMCEKLRPLDAKDRYNLAGLRAIMATAVFPGDESEAAAKDAGAEADRAMAWLKQAVEAGFEDAQLIKTNKDLDVLRSREDFKRLLTDVESNREKRRK